MPKVIDDDVYDLVVKALRTANAYKLPNAQQALEALTGRVQSAPTDNEQVTIRPSTVKGGDEEME